MSMHSENSSRHHVGTFLLALLLILAAMLLMGQTAVQPSDDPIDGKQVFERTCATCHSIQPPPYLAPPMAMVVRHYRMALADSAELKEALVGWIASPDSTRSRLPAHVIERFGLMAPVALTPEEIGTVVDYVMTLDSEMGRRSMMGGGMMMMDSVTTGMNCIRQRPRSSQSSWMVN